MNKNTFELIKSLDQLKQSNKYHKLPTIVLKNKENDTSIPTLSTWFMIQNRLTKENLYCVDIINGETRERLKSCKTLMIKIAEFLLAFLSKNQPISFPKKHLLENWHLFSKQRNVSLSVAKLRIESAINILR